MAEIALVDETQDDRRIIDNEIGAHQVLDEEGLQIENVFFEFLDTFSITTRIASTMTVLEEGNDDLLHGEEEHFPYHTQLDYLQTNGFTTLYVDFDHIRAFNPNLGEWIMDSYGRFSPFINKATQRFIRSKNPGFTVDEKGRDREFFVGFHNLPRSEKVRDLRTNKIGKLVSFTGTVTRTSEVRPELLFGTFECQECGKLMKNVEQQFKYTEPKRCGGIKCTNMKRWTLKSELSLFVNWQRIHVQENANEIPAGSMPRSIDVIVRHETVERAKPGDRCVFTGAVIVIPDVSKLAGTSQDRRGGNLGSSHGFPREQGEGISGLRALGVREMNYRMAFLACSVQPIVGRGNTAATIMGTAPGAQHFIEEETKEMIRNEFSVEEVERLQKLASSPNLLRRIVKSVAPTVFGHEDIKLAVILMLLGGVHKETKEGTKIRGDINVCIVGDPSTAKSQFLKYVCSFFPRAIYTSGKASSAAGLTASVVKDPETGEFCIEAGALMLADNGICCIDEFDKMDEVDQTAIHEAMEQQTISITKAGIQATLNARTSILAAANPIHGRYDRTKSLKANMTCGPAIMSRFDLFFVVLDDCDEAADRAIAEHIVLVHQKRVSRLLSSSNNPGRSEVEEDENDDEGDDDIMMTLATANGRTGASNELFNTSILQRYIRYGRTIDPIIPPNVQPKLVDCYLKLRQGDLVGRNRAAYRITVRQFEALIRLSEAMARLHLDTVVRESYVMQAFKLLKTSIVHVHSEDVEFDPEDAIPEEPENEEPNTLNEEEKTDGGGSLSKHDDVTKKPRIPSEEYEDIGHKAAEYLRKEEDEHERRGNKDVFQGIPQAQVVDYLIDERIEQNKISDGGDLANERSLMNQIISRLILKEKIIIVLDNPSAIWREEVPKDERRFLVCHPNYTASFWSNDRS